MRVFFDENLLLYSEEAIELYKKARKLPIIDYHCHLNENEIAENRVFLNLSELWLTTDHYKWRAMRLCGVDEKYITGDASDYEKFFEYAKIMPRLAGNPLYYWTHMELKMIFGIHEPLNESTAKSIYETAEKQLTNLSVQKLLNKFKVEYIATTDDPLSDLKNHKRTGNTVVAPTFRPDKIFELDESYIKQLCVASGIVIDSLSVLKSVLEKRLQFFISKKCKIADHGMDFLPGDAVSEQEATSIFDNRAAITSEGKAKFFSHMMDFFAGLYSKYEITMQLHCGTYRNINTKMFTQIGRDAGFDVFRSSVDTDCLIRFLNRLHEKNILPQTILYSLHPDAIPAMCTISGAFRNVRVGAAWWFNDSVEGIRKQLSNLSEYAALGTTLGMLTDSRSFTSYVRFDFFRRIVANHIGELVQKGEYNTLDAEKLIIDICYDNAKQFILH